VLIAELQTCWEEARQKQLGLLQRNVFERDFRV